MYMVDFSTTEKFLKSCGLDETVGTESIYQKLSVVESGVLAISESITDSYVVNTTLSYTHSAMLEALDNVKNLLLELASRVLSVINNYCLNSTKLFDKYRELIMDRVDKSNLVITHDTFTYPDLGNKSYPKELKATVAAGSEILSLQNRLETDPYLDADRVGQEVDHLILNFAEEVIGGVPDLDFLQSSVRDIVLEHVRGDPIRMVVNTKTLKDVFHAINNYKRDRDDIKRTRKAIIANYTALRNLQSRAMSDPMKFIEPKLASVADPDRAAFIAKEKSSYASIHMELMRLFNTYILIYRVAFKTKLDELNNKVNDYRNLLNDILTRTGLLAALNTKSTEYGEDTIPYSPVKPIKRYQRK